MKLFKTLSIILAGTLAAAMVLTGCSSKTATSSSSSSGISGKTLKVAMLSTGAVNDGGWNEGAYNAIQAIKKKYGCTVNYTENVTDSQMKQVISTYANQGYNLIFGHGYEFSDAFKSIAPSFPKTDFIAVNGSSSDKNLFSTNFKFGELGYFTGMTAGLMTKSNKVGIIIATDAPTNMADVDTFKQGVKAVNPNADVSVSIVGSWNDIPKAKEAASALVGQKCDVLLSQGDSFSIGVFQAAAAAGAYAIGWSEDQHSMMPDTVITSGVQDITTLYETMAADYLGGKLSSSKKYTFGMKDNDAQKLGVFNSKVPQDVQDKVNQAIKDYKSGKLTLNLKY